MPHRRCYPRIGTTSGGRDGETDQVDYATGTDGGHTGEVRPTHRQEAKPGRWWRSRPDPFAAVWPVLLGWLEEKPDIEAKAMLKRLQSSGYGEFPDGQLRTLQRRVQAWRQRIVQQLVYGTEQQNAEVTRID